jgi:hypothetical protein
MPCFADAPSRGIDAEKGRLLILVHSGGLFKDVDATRRRWTGTTLESCKTSHQQKNQRHLDEPFAGLHLSLVTLAHPAVSGEPAKRALDYFQVSVAVRIALVGQLLPTVRRISLDSFELGDEVLQSGQHSMGALRIAHVRRRDMYGDRLAQRVDQGMALAAFHAFMNVKAADAR